MGFDYSTLRIAVIVGLYRTMLKKPGNIDDPLYVVAVISNPARFHTRIRLFKEFQARMAATPGVKLLTVELAYGDNQFHVTEPGRADQIQLRALDELWAKENMINVGISRLPADWKYVAWIDGDVEFNNAHWVQETIHQLQTHHVVQMFQNALDLGPRGEVIQLHTGFGFQFNQGVPMPWKVNKDSPMLSAADPYGYGIVQNAGRVQGAYWHSGYAWAANREAIDMMGGLADWAVIGSGDHHMAMAFVGEAHRSVPAHAPLAYRDTVMAFQEHAKQMRGDLGFVEGTILHHWHGKKKSRRYLERWDIITKNNFNPNTDIKKDWQGMFQLRPELVNLRNDLRTYFRQRDEDSIDTE